MSIANCLAKLVTEGRINQEQAEAAKTLNEQLAAGLAPEMGPSAADAAGALEAARAIIKGAEQKLLTASRQARHA